MTERAAAATDRGGRPRIRRLLLLSGAGLLLYAALMLAWAALGAHAARQHLRGAESDLRVHRYESAGQQLAEAHASLSAVRLRLHLLGPLLPVSRTVPLVRVQVRALETYVTSGIEVTDAFGRVLNAAGPLLTPRAGLTPDDAVPLLKDVQSEVQRSVPVVRRASERVSDLDRYRLLWPLSDAHRDLETRLSRASSLTTDAARDLSGLLALAGADRPLSLLCLSQNPDEVRPTGGFIGTYGLVTTDAGRIRLTRFGPSESWYHAHPGTAVPVRDSPLPLRLSDPPLPQTFSNVNVGPEWTAAAALAQRMWAQGGERPVDGVVSFTPEALARLLAELGPVRVPGYPDRVTAENLVERADYYTHRSPAGRSSAADRKDFVAQVSHAVLQRVVEAPASSWVDLARALGLSLSKGEVMASSDDPVLAGPLRAHRWDGRLPSSSGDFLAAAEFEYAAKNGRFLRRVMTHDVVLQADGTGTASTTLTVRNEGAPDPQFNIDSRSVITMYGPRNAVLVPPSQPPLAYLEPVEGHPAPAYLRAALPGGQTSLSVSWRAPDLVRSCGVDCLEYTLVARGTPSHFGDVLRLSVTPPPGWRWRSTPPPAELPLTYRVEGRWLMKRES